MNSFLVVLTVVGALVLGFFLVVWPVRKMAQQMGAGKSTYGACVLAILLSGAAGSAAAFGAETLGFSPLLALPISVFVSLFIYSSILETTIFLGFVISVMATIISALLLVGTFMVLAPLLAGAMMFGMAGSSSSDMDSMMDMENMDCVETVTRWADGRHVRSSTKCSSGSGSFSSSSEPSEGSTARAGSLPSPDEPAANAPPRKRVFAFQETDVEFLPGQIGKRVQIVTKDGREHAGTLIAVDDDIIRIEKRMRGGSMEFFLREPEVRSVKVLDEVH